ncbi:MAG: hypothetical protein AB1586_08455 [Pseudomonadota bacterium]
MSSLPPTDRAAPPVTACDPAHVHAVRGWLLALLRLAVTHDPADRADARAAACGLDRIRTPTAADTSFRFFETASTALCAAIIDPAFPDRREILRRHIARIADIRLRRAFAAAVEMEAATSADRPPTPPNRTPPQRKSPSRTASPRASLWRGLG